MMKLFIYPVLFICLLVFSFCGDSDSVEGNQDSADRTLIVYMAADNDLALDAEENIFEIEKGFTDTGARIVLFVDQQGKEPYLYEISGKRKGILKIYSEFNSAEPEQIGRVLQEIVQDYPSESYGLILWSHSSSWLPSGHYLRSFGTDGGISANIPELAEALPVRFDFILFDACLMGSVEVAYELREKTRYILAPSTESIAEGFPYRTVIPELLKKEPDLPAAAKKYYEHYNQLKGAYRSATVAVIDTWELEGLAAEVGRLFSRKKIDFASFERKSVQRLDTYVEQYHFDLLDFIHRAFPELDKSAFISQLDKVVLYKAHTPEFLLQFTIDTYCGLSCYIPVYGREDLNNYYKELQWNSACSILP